MIGGRGNSYFSVDVEVNLEKSTVLEPTGIKEKSAIRAKVKHSAKECIFFFRRAESGGCLLYTSDAADE